ncbi:MAG: hypothetical protein LBC02_07785, partial [Planctomycetaceae bacterium]|nr:hypothetical protein [Planctomycetaceae bacterium]
MNLESCFEKTAWQRSRNAPLEKGLKGVRIDVTLVSQVGQEIRLTNLWQLYKHAFGEGYCTCLNDVGTGEIVVKKLEDGTLEVTHYE